MYRGCQGGKMYWRLLLLTAVLSCATALPSLDMTLNDTEDQTTVWDTHSAPSGIDFRLFPGDDEEYSVAIDKRQIAAASCYLMFANRRFLVQMSTSGSVLQVFRLGDDANAISLDFDHRQRYVFWTDVAQRKIFSARPDATGVQLLVSTGITVPDGVAWDWVNFKLYWTDAEEKDIEVLDPVRSGSYRKVLIETGATSLPRALVLDPRTKMMYWTDWGTTGKIEKASMDGTNRRVLHDTGLVWPNGLTLDYATQILYWVDASLDKIESCNTDGSNRRLLSTTTVLHPFGVTVFQGNLYWTDWQLNALLTAPISQPTAVTTVFQGLTFDPMQIHYVCAERQPLAPNPCGSNYGGCSHLCLLSSLTFQGYTCGCPEGMTLSADRRTCRTGIPNLQCSPNCRNGGQCIGGRCICPPGFTGPICEIATCDPDCQNGGTCVSGHCICSSGWTGPQCAQAVCNPMCQNGGTCSNGRCTCTFRWRGVSCQEEICFPECLNGGRCSLGHCVCPSKYDGIQCENEVCNPPCRNGHCANGQCICSRGWEGDQCEQAVCFPPSGCLNGGYCVSPGICICPYKWIGERCDEAVCTRGCVHGDCTAPDTCTCDHAWTGPTCSQAICFPPDGCLHGGHCAVPGICSCTQEWTGPRCEDAVCVPFCRHGDCVKPDECYCHAGYEGDRCTDPMCIPKCLNGGTCVLPGLCACPFGFVGSRCEA